MTCREQKETRPKISEPSTVSSKELRTPEEAFGSPLALLAMRIGQSTVHNHLDHSKEPMVVFEIYKDFSYLSVRIVEEALKEERNVPKIACADGCAYCCDISVLTLPHEIFLIAFTLRRHLEPRSFQHLKAHLAEIGPKTGAMTTDQRLRAKIPCSLLQRGHCSIYPIRPMSCVGFNSSSKEQCIKYYVDEMKDEIIPIVSPPFIVANALNSGALIAIYERGLDDSTLELNQGLDFVLSKGNLDDLCKRWLNGEKIFTSIRQDEGPLRPQNTNRPSQSEVLAGMSELLNLTRNLT